MASPKASPETRRARAAAVALAEGVVLAVVACVVLLAAWQTLLMVLACSGVGYAMGAWLCRTGGEDDGGR